jgi:hypothetical protein
MLTIVSTAAWFGKPYAPAAITILGFFILAFVCLALPGLWGWSEKLGSLF